MSRRHSRTRKRRARPDDLRLAVEAARAEGPEALWKLLKGQANSLHQHAWDVARVADLDEEERAMVAQAVNPKLAGMTPGSVALRENRGKKS